MSKIFTKHTALLLFFFASFLSNTNSQSCAGNLLTNPGFESGLSNWNNWGSLTTSSTAYSGNNAGYVGAGVASGGTNAVAAVPGNRYEVRAFARITPSVTWAAIGITFFDASQNILEIFSQDITSNIYQQYTISAVAPNGTVYVGVSLGKDNAGELWADDFCLTTVAPGATVSIGNRIFFDKNGNGLMDIPTDFGVDGNTVVIYADNNNDGVADGPAIASTITANGGKYNFTGLAPGNYFVQMESVPDWMFLSPNNGGDPDNDIEGDNNGLTHNTTTKIIKGGTITLSAGNEPGGINYNSTYDFGIYKYNGLGDFVWLDNNANGQQDAGEPGISGVTVRLKNSTNNAILATTTTDSKGYYNFEDPAGRFGVISYNIEFISPVGYKPTLANKVANDELDSDAINGLINNITVPVGTINNSFDAGFVPDNVLLPVKLTSFTATLNGNKVGVNWVTENETNLNFFVVERSIDGINFENAGIVFSSNNNTGKGSYNLNDNVNQLQTGIIYYRLRSVDKDGSNNLSATRIIKLTKQGAGEALNITTYPNPVINELRITIPAAWQNKKVVYEVVSLSGQVLKSITKSNAGQTETMDVTNLQSGMYIIRVNAANLVISQKLVKQ